MELLVSTNDPRKSKFEFYICRDHVNISIMLTPDLVRQFALSFPKTKEQPHFEKTSFRVNKKIFATLNAPQRRVTIKLSAKDQDLFILYDPTIIYPVPNKWGKHGWTQIDLTRVPEEMLADALTAAYCEVAPHNLVAELMAELKQKATQKGEDWD